MSFIHLDLCSGLEGWRTWQSVEYKGVDNDPKFDANVTRDLRELNVSFFRSLFRGYWGKHDLLITASPPCTGFTIMQVGRNWHKCPETGVFTPKTETARLGLELLEKTVSLIRELELEYPGEVFWVIENPRAIMRKMPIVQDLNNRVVTWCQYPEGRKIQTMKPTDLWLSENLDSLSDVWYREPCKKGSPCHVAAPRGSYTGTQGMDKAEAAKIPSELASLIATAVYYRRNRR